MIFHSSLLHLVLKKKEDVGRCVDLIVAGFIGTFVYTTPNDLGRSQTKGHSETYTSFRRVLLVYMRTRNSVKNFQIGLYKYLLIHIVYSFI